MLTAGIDLLFCVVGPSYWGKGATEKEAYDNAIKEGMRRSASYQVFLVPPSCRLSESGLNWHWNDNEPFRQVILLKEIRKKS
jgi:hypothetical protein